MNKSIKRVLRLPIRLALAVMFFTLATYLFGPIRWIKQWNGYEVATIALLLSYFVAFGLGYHYRVSRRRLSSLHGAWGGVTFEVQRWLGVLKYTIIINLLLTVGNAFLYTQVRSVSSLFSEMLRGLTSPSAVYYEKDASSRASSIIVWVTLLYSPMMYVTQFQSLYLFRKLKLSYKVMVVFTFMVEVARWLALGTNKGLFDIVLLFGANYVIKIMRFYSIGQERTRKNRKRNVIILFICVAAVIAFFAFFGKAMSARVGGAYDPDNFSRYPYSLIPKEFRVLAEKFDSYLVQGYDHLEEIIEHCKFKWTFGVGNSRFLMDSIRRISGLNLTPRTYPYQLQAFGVDPLVSWHSAYAWFASDLTFFGIIPLMFFAGSFFARLCMDVVLNEYPVAMTLFYLMVLMIVNASCTNYVLAYSNGFIGFWVLFFIYWLKKKVVFKIGRLRLSIRS